MKKLRTALYNIIIDINDRHKNLNQAWFWFELYDIFEKNLNNKTKEYGDIVKQLFWNNYDNKMVSHIYDDNSWLRDINIKLYDALRKRPENEQIKRYEDIKIDHKILVTQANSLIQRAKGLKKPTEFEKWTHHLNIKKTNNGFVRLWHYEKELHISDKVKREYQESEIYGWIIFNKNIEETIPYSEIKLSSSDIYREQLLCGRYNNALYLFIQQIRYTIKTLFKKNNKYNYIVCSLIQNMDRLENYKILRINHNLIKILWLKVAHFTQWLYATNKKWEIILRFNQRNSGYLWDQLNGEIPKLSWSELLLRSDYFDKLIDIYWSTYKYQIFAK